MKIRSAIVMVSLIFGAFSTQLSAQSAAKSYQGWGDDWFFYTEVYCDGVQVDYVAGYLKLHIVRHSDDGLTVKWDIYQAKGSGVSLWTGESFSYKEMDKVSYVEGIYEWHYHLKGKMGHDYMGKAVWNMITDEVTFGPTSCH